MDDYWVDRVGRNETRAQKIAEHYSKHLNKFYKQMLNDIQDEVEKLYAQIKADGAESLTATQLYNFSRYQELKELIYKECRELGMNQISITESTIQSVFEATFSADFGELQKAGNTLSILSTTGVDKILKSSWSGQNYSDRIWSNTAKLAENVRSGIVDMVVKGKTPDEIKKGVIAEFGVSYRQADRLVRTEASYTFNQTTLDRYNRAGVEKVYLITEDDCCDECAELAGSTYLLDNAPLIPIHPNCRCCYAPVLEDINDSNVYTATTKHGE